MAKVGIFFGSDTGKTRKVAKQIHEALGSDAVAAPVNINKASIDDLLACDALILGTPTLGTGQLPGLDADCQAESWGEFVPELESADLSGVGAFKKRLKQAQDRLNDGFGIDQAMVAKVAALRPAPDRVNTADCPSTKLVPAKSMFQL